MSQPQSAVVLKSLQRLLKDQTRRTLFNTHGPEDSIMESYVNSTGEKVTARQLTADSVTIVSVWCGAAIVAEHDALDYEMTFKALTVPTPSGPKRASQGDYVVRNAEGQFDVVKAYQFRTQFREV